MNHNEIERLIYRILATEDEEIACDQVFELIARYVDLEVMGDNVAQLMPMVYQHLVQCDMCADLHDTLYDLAEMEERGTLPEADDLLREILASTTGSVAPPASDLPGAAHVSPKLPHRSAESPDRASDTTVRSRVAARPAAVAPARSSMWFNLGWAAAAVALVVAMALGTWGWTQASQMRSEEAFIAGADRAVALRGTEQDPDARGYLFVNEAQGRALLTIIGLNTLPSDQVYQVWLMTDTGTTSAGTFTVGEDQRGRAFIELKPGMAEFTSLAITPEPKGGSSQPTGSPVCVWGKQQL